jgi:hypothetical protein
MESEPMRLTVVKAWSVRVGIEREVEIDGPRNSFGMFIRST